MNSRAVGSGASWVCALAGLLASGCETEVPIPTLVVSTTALPDVRVGGTYSARVDATGGTQPYSFSVSAGALPDGLSLASTGELTGIAAVAGRKSFTVAVADAKGMSASAPLTLYVIPDPLEIVTTTLPAGKEGTPYDQPLVARGGVAPLAWSVAEGSLPPGLTVAPAGRLSGTPSAFGLFDFKVRVTDAESTARDQNLRLTLSSLNPMIETSTVPKGRLNQPYEVRFRASGGQAPYAWSLESTPPAGLAMASDGTLAGTPGAAGDFTLTVKVTDASARTDMADVPLRVLAPLIISTPALPQAITGRDYRFQLQAAGGEPPYVWSIGSGALPAGFSLAQDGLVTGRSDTTGTVEVTIRVRDAEGALRSGLFPFRVSDRFDYPTVPTDGSIPPTCTGTTVSYRWVDIPVVESYQVTDVNVAVDVDYTWNPNSTCGGGPRQRSCGIPRLVLFGPDGVTQAPLCGNGANIPGGNECDASDMKKEFDDDGARTVRPERPLSVFDGMNAQGTWRLLLSISYPRCTNVGTINSVTLTIQDDRATEPYTMVTGYERNNLVTVPFLRVWSNASPAGVEQHELNLVARRYSVGPNGFREGGKGDDVAEATPFTWSWAGAPIPGVTVEPDGRVSIDAPSAICPGTCNGTGEGSLAATGGGETVNLPLLVVPPDFNRTVREF